MILKKTVHAAAAATLAAMLAAPVSLASPPSSGKTTTKDAKQEIIEVGREIETYTAQQRDKAVEKVKTALGEMDTRIDRVETWTDENWDRMDRSSREKMRKALAELRNRRNQAAEWYGGLKYSSAKSWEHMKRGFSNSYDALREAWEKAVKERDSSKK